MVLRANALLLFGDFFGRHCVGLDRGSIRCLALVELLYGIPLLMVAVVAAVLYVLVYMIPFTSSNLAQRDASQWQASQWRTVCHNVIAVQPQLRTRPYATGMDIHRPRTAVTALDL